MESLDWLIIGGGIHGVHIAARLVGEAGVKADRLRILDPGERLLERWRTSTTTTGMTHLRSSSVHHLDLDPWSLQHFAIKRRKRTSDLFAFPHNRPALALFNAHSENVIARFDLADLHIQARANRCSIDSEEIGVQLSDGRDISARNIVLALGTSEQPYWPDWAPQEDARVHHVFEPEFDGWPSSTETVVVVGGGITAAQIALRLLNEGHRVHVVSRHPMRQHHFDSDPGWLGPRYMAGFNRERDLDRRRAWITRARRRGSVPPGIRRVMLSAIEDDQVCWHEDEVESLDGHGAEIQLRLSNKAGLTADRVLLATGFASHRPGGTMIDELIASASLPCASCGYPVVDSALRWHPGVYVSGPLAELELGPVARNIAGARRAGDRLVEAIHSNSTAASSA